MLRCGEFTFPLDRPLIMGIVNLTVDSFSGDGLASSTARAILRAEFQIESGADILDIGAESSRPGATPIPSALEIERLLPVLDALQNCGVPISVDTCKPEVMRAVLDHGASMINDIYALAVPGALEAVRDSQCAICLMHMRGTPQTMQNNTVYADVVKEVREFLKVRVHEVQAAGIAKERLILDPGFGFGKSPEHNLELLRHIDDFALDGLPVLAGLSRKSMLGQLTGRPINERTAASLSAALLAAQRGAKILRVHDVAETYDVLTILEEVHRRS